MRRSRQCRRSEPRHVHRQGAAGVRVWTEPVAGAALQATNGCAVATYLAAAISALDTTFVGPGIVDGATRFTETERDGPAMVLVFEFDADCSCLQYTGEPVPA